MQAKSESAAVDAHAMKEESKQAPPVQEPVSTMKTEAVSEPEITQKVEQKKEEKAEAKTSTEAFGSTE